MNAVTLLLSMLSTMSLRVLSISVEWNRLYAENEIVAKFFQDIDEDVSLQLILRTSMEMEDEHVHIVLVLGHVYPGVYLMFHGIYQ